MVLVLKCKVLFVVTMLRSTIVKYESTSVRSPYCRIFVYNLKNRSTPLYFFSSVGSGMIKWASYTRPGSLAVATCPVWLVDLLLLLWGCPNFYLFLLDNFVSSLVRYAICTSICLMKSEEHCFDFKVNIYV